MGRINADVYVIGLQKSDKCVFIAYVQYADGTRLITQGTRYGRQELKNEFDIMRTVLSFIREKNVSATVHTNMNVSALLANISLDGNQTNTAELEKKSYKFDTVLPKHVFSTFKYLIKTIEPTTVSMPESTVWQRTIPFFCVALYDTDGNLSGKPLTDVDFQGSLASAREFVKHWEQLSADKNSEFYGYKIESYNIENTPKKGEQWAKEQGQETTE